MELAADDNVLLAAVLGDLSWAEGIVSGLQLHFLQHRFWRWNGVECLDHGIGEFGGSGCAADVARDVPPLAVYLLQCQANVVSGILFA